MNARYHIQITKEALDKAFSGTDLQVIIDANLAQDSLPNLIGHPEIHFDDNQLAAGLRYIEEQRRQAVESIVERRDRRAALQSFGRLLHGRQDFYAHSNWVRLWIDANGGLDACTPEDIPICADPLAVPQLFSCTASAWRYLVYRTPLLGDLVKRIYLPPDSHEAMNLDHPGQGPLFQFAMVAAIKHTQAELEVLMSNLEAAGDRPAVADLLGGAGS